MAESKVAKLVQRHQRVAFMNVGTADAPEFTRMKKFTSMTNNKNPKEYARQYVDEVYRIICIIRFSAHCDIGFCIHPSILKMRPEYDSAEFVF